MLVLLRLVKFCDIVSVIESGDFLVNDSIFLMDKFFLLGNFIKRNYENKEEIYNFNDKKEFLKLVENTVEDIMNLLIQDIYLENKDIVCKCELVKMKLSCQGKFSYFNDDFKIVLNKAVINNLYNGDILSLLTIFHELNHMLVYCECEKGTINFHLVRCIKENLLQKLGMEVKDRSIKKPKPGYAFFLLEGFESYYKNNYKLDSEEKLVNIKSVYDFFEFIEYFNIEIKKQEYKYLNEILKNNIEEYQNYKRDVSNISIFNSNFIDFEKAFDIMIKEHREWLSIPQLQIEYYLGENGRIYKRSKEELLKLLEKETNKENIEYLKLLIDGNDKLCSNQILNKKILKKSIF